MTPSTLALARRVRALLAEPERWTQGCYARDASGRAVNSGDRSAQSWDIMGAMKRCGGWTFPMLEMLNAEAGGDFVSWNDAPGRTHADVLALLDRVIAEGER